MATLTETLTAADIGGENPVGVAVTISAVSADRDAPVYSPDGAIVRPVTVFTSEAGRWSVELYPNSELTPPTALYRVSRDRSPGPPAVSWHLIAGDEDAEVTTAETVVDDPNFPDSSTALASHIASETQAAGHPNWPDAAMLADANIFTAENTFNKKVTINNESRTSTALDIRSSEGPDPDSEERLLHIASPGGEPYFVVTNDGKVSIAQTLCAHLISEAQEGVGTIFLNQIGLASPEEGSLTMIEQTTRPPALSGYGRIFFEDNGFGQQRLMVQFQSGDPQQIKLEGAPSGGEFDTDLLPWRYRIHPQSIPDADNASTFDWDPPVTGRRYTLNLNDFFEYGVVLAAGSWKCNVGFIGRDDAGIVSVQLDGAEQAVIDTYRAVGDYNLAEEIDLEVTSSKRYLLRCQVAGKNEASSGHVQMIQFLDLRRTA